ncbi:MAG: sulfatase-like hydrolase/transferase [Bryobacterales bacterium]|nr:sulfatase-like hydrolase/transferase [Bryobacterales bacterium]
MLNRRSFLQSAALTASAPALAQRKEAPSARPNIVLILADDLADWMLGCYGNREIRTPNIDLLARSGTRFQNSFVCTPISSPSRATLFTGRTPSQHGIQDFLTARPVEQPPQGQRDVPPSFASEVFLSDLLKQAGYRTGYIGKWHMGGDRSPGHGFDWSATVEARTYSDPTYYLNGKETPRQGFLTELNTAYAEEFINQGGKDQPFFLTLGYLNPHTPYSGHPQRYYDMYAGAKFDSIGWLPKAPNALREKEMMDDVVGNIRKCAASVTALDDQIPRLLKALDARGVRGNTLVIFTGDNGYLLGRHGLWSKGHASNPINMYEESMRVPMIWHWRGKIPVEAARPEMISSYDLLPSLCDVAGIEPPAHRNLCGRSYWPLVRNQPRDRKNPWPTTVFGHFRNTGMARDGRFKVILRNEVAGPNELFDLSQDAREQMNHYDNPQYATVRERLTAQWDAWRRRTQS